MHSVDDGATPIQTDPGFAIPLHTAPPPGHEADGSSQPTPASSVEEVMEDEPGYGHGV